MGCVHHYRIAAELVSTYRAFGSLLQDEPIVILPVARLRHPHPARGNRGQLKPVYRPPEKRTRVPPTRRN